MEVVKMQPIDSRAQLPVKGSEGAAGMDLKASQMVVINPGQTGMVDTGWNIEIPKGHVGLVCSRSGLAAKQGVFVLNAPGIVDEDYRGEIKVILHNAGNTAFVVNVGDRIGQLVLMKLPEWEVMLTGELSASARGTNGFGSTGT
jgi:dUTP pyrophosphatase